MTIPWETMTEEERVTLVLILIKQLTPDGQLHVAACGESYMYHTNPKRWEVPFML